MPSATGWVECYCPLPKNFLSETRGRVLPFKFDVFMCRQLITRPRTCTASSAAAWLYRSRSSRS
ncbi:hypothetical protein ACFFX0_19005 [Citricoccus parietis]|uniref:Uncharacterized protein n=1 Tax=Citricoccus parietis TaxID=592307 RepID=A0ABV5G2K9_9MICC